MAIQEARGSQNVLISDVDNSTITITIGGGSPRVVALEPAVTGIGATVSSPARMLRARSGVVPYVDRGGLTEELEQWTGGEEPFRGCVVGGRGGSGKTRLGVELCLRARAVEWLAGHLPRHADQGSMETLVTATTDRLVVIDYAESRIEQLNELLPLLAREATPEQRVRVLLLVRAAPRQGDDWTEALRDHDDWLDVVLDDMACHALADTPFEAAERRELFGVAGTAFAGRSPTPVEVPDPPALLDQAIFASPLLVAIAAYLAVHGTGTVPNTRADLLKVLLAHERHYWRPGAGEPPLDPELAQRIVALATLAGAATENGAAELLRLLPDLADANAERRGRLARWAHTLYPGDAWWSPLEPDLLAEHLVADCFTDQPAVLTGVLDRADPTAVVRPLDLYARAVPDHPGLRAALGPVVTQRLGPLCDAAIAQAATETDRDVLLGQKTIASALNRVVGLVDLDADQLPEILDRFPGQPNLVLGSLALTLESRCTAHLRPLAEAHPAAYEPDLARSLNNLSNRLAEAGRREEGLAAVEEAVAVRRRLAEANPAAYEPGLARSLNNLSVHLAEAGRREEGLAAVEEAVKMHRRLAGANPAAYEPDLASSLNNLSVRLAEAGQWEDGLAAIEEAVEVHRRLARANPAAYEPDLATSLNNLSVHLAEAGRHDEAESIAKEAASLGTPS
ncbi:MAG TPA: tetratricopeptide repeat protein [Acidimicrobiales bacterium]|nr:tetratricopeptide repeat protein [Acidimicrobiales bacterium]